jgi:CO/xanthine dehydrogenase FAD-binding subunit
MYLLILTSLNALSEVCSYNTFITAVLGARRQVAITEFFTGGRQTCLQPDEVILGIRIPFSSEVMTYF